MKESISLAFMTIGVVIDVSVIHLHPQGIQRNGCDLHLSFSVELNMSMNMEFEPLLNFTTINASLRQRPLFLQFSRKARENRHNHIFRTRFYQGQRRLAHLVRSHIRITVVQIARKVNSR